MNIVVTGSSGFIGQHLCESLMQVKDCNVLKVNSRTTEKDLDEYLQKADFVYHLAATHRPKDIEDFKRINVDYFQRILLGLEKNQNPCPVVFTSSIHAGNGSDYGKSKIEGENILHSYAERTNARIHILRLTNTFGKYAKPNHTSVVATFCYNISHNKPIIINDKNSQLNLCYIDDVIKEMLSYINIKFSTERLIDENLVTKTTVGRLAEDLYKISFGQMPYPYIKDYHSALSYTYRWYKKQE